MNCLLFVKLELFRFVKIFKYSGHTLKSTLRMRYVRAMYFLIPHSGTIDIRYRP